MTARALILGAAGQLGRALQQAAPSSVIVFAHDYGETDVRNSRAIDRAIEEFSPDVIVNCAAFTNVDAAETQRDEAMELNGVAPGLIAESAKRAGVRMIHVSTDYVFDGSGSTPYTLDAPTNPINVYGATKLEGERRVLAVSSRNLVVRTAWLHSGGGTNFVRTVARILGSGTVMGVVDDQIGTPTRAVHLADALWRLCDRSDVTGVIHFTDAGVASWFDVAVAVYEALDAAGHLRDGAGLSPIRSDQFPTAARRPRFSVLDKHDSWNSVGFVPPHWRHGVATSVRELLDA